MTLRKRINKKGGCEYASVSDNYNLLENALNQIKTKGGCTSYADVNSSYMITDTKKGGNRKYKKGGNFDLLSTSRDLFNRSNALFGNNAQPPAAASAPPPPAPPAPPAPQASAPQASAPQAPQAQKGGNIKYKQGGKLDLLYKTNALLSNNGGCGCSTNMKKGGAIELAPFAAAVALMAARYMADIDEIKPKPNTKSVSKPKTKSVSKPNTKSVSKPKTKTKSYKK